jgi:hypothetical protein
MGIAHLVCKGRVVHSIAALALLLVRAVTLTARPVNSQVTIAAKSLFCRTVFVRTIPGCAQKKIYLRVVQTALRIMKAMHVALSLIRKCSSVASKGNALRHLSVIPPIVVSPVRLAMLIAKSSSRNVPSAFYKEVSEHVVERLVQIAVLKILQDTMLVRRKTMPPISAVPKVSASQHRVARPYIVAFLVRLGTTFVPGTLASAHSAR